MRADQAIQLLDLPAELRSKIWNYVVDPELDIKYEETGSGRERGSFSVVPSWAGAVQANRQIQAEMRSVVVSAVGSHKIVTALEPDPSYGAKRSGFHSYEFRRVDPRSIVRLEPVDASTPSPLQLYVFEIDGEGRLRKTEQYHWWCRLSDRCAGVARVEREFLRRLEFREVGGFTGWHLRLEIPTPERHSHILEAMGLKFEDCTLPPAYKRAMEVLEQQGWGPMTGLTR